MIVAALARVAAEPWVQRLGWTLVQFLWQGTVISMLYAAVRKSLGRRARPQKRYALSCATLAVLAATPFATFVVHPDVPLVLIWPVPSPDAWQSILPWLVAFWFSGVLLSSARLFSGWHVTASLRRNGTQPAPADWERTLEALIQRLRVARPVRVLLSSLVDVPIVLGWWRPVILVPVAAFSGLPPAHVEAILSHELAHVRRFDDIVNALQGFIEAALFFHPAVWWISDHIRSERELCCDDVAVETSGDRLAYARALVELESRRPAHRHALAASGGSLLDRVTRLLGDPQPAIRTLPGPAAAVAMTALWLVGVGAIGTHAAPHMVTPLAATVAAPATGIDRPTQTPLLSTLLFGPVGPAVPPSAQQRPALPSPAAPQTGSLEGAIVGDNGKPVPRAHVTIASEDQRVMRTILADDAGVYAFSDLPPGRYSLSASKAGYFDGAYGQKAQSRAGTPVPVAAGDRVAHVDIHLSRGSVITGQIRDENGDPAINVPVQVLRFDSQTGERRLVSYTSTITDDRGWYRAYTLPPGTYLVAAVPRSDFAGPSQPGGRAGGGGRGGRSGAAGDTSSGDRNLAPSSRDSRTDHVPVYFPGTVNSASAGAVTVANNEERTGVDFQLQLEPTATLQGTIAGLDTLPGSFRLVGLEGVPGELRRHGDIEVSGGAPVSYTISPNGLQTTRQTDGSASPMRFTIQGVAPGRYAIEVRAVKRSPGGPPQIEWGELQIVVDGHDQKDLLIFIQDGMTITGRLSADPSPGAPVPDFALMRVTATPRPTIYTDEVSPFEIGRAAVDGSGRFTIPGVAPGSYTLSVAGPGGWIAKSATTGGRDALDFGLAVKATDPPGELAIVVTDRTTALGGTVRDSSGQPAPDGTVIVFAEDSQYWVPQSRRIQAVRPGSDGTFKFRDLPAGDYLMTAVSDIETGQWFDPSVLQRIRGSATRLKIGDGEKKTQDLVIR